MRTFSFCLVLITSAAATAAEPWPEFRGPTADGHATSANLPVEWSESENVVWKTPIHGRGWSSPVIWGDRIWMTTATPEGHRLSAVCVDLKTGRVVHDFVVFEVAEPRDTKQFNSFASPTPVIEEGRAYLSWGSYGLVCLDSDSADVIWVRRDLECNHYRGPGSSPILHAGMLILHYDGYDYQYVVALDKETGNTIWRTERPHDFETDNGDHKKAYGTPLVIETPDGTQQLISPTSKGTFAYDPATGEELWRVRYKGFSTACRPLYEHGLIFISSGFSRSEILAVDPTGRGDVTDTHIRWIEKKSMPSKPSPLIVGDYLYTIDDRGVATCLEATTGEKVWQTRVGGNFSASPITAGGRLYLFSQTGKTTILAARPEYEVLAENHLDEGTMASPAVAGNALILRTDGHLYRIEDQQHAADGE
ncbi:outer membrane protein assembly factor BamB family protein [Maioricimonas rarisocia]|nr:PQQ-binding-like beta-propeller repeat protein [Maioricimonas rarisocia]